MPSRIDLKIIVNQLADRLVDLDSHYGIEHITTMLVDCIHDDDVKELIDHFQEIWDTGIEAPDDEDEDENDE